MPTALGYDAWAWMVWGRELAHLDLDTTAGPSWKPLPALVAAPLSVVLGDATPTAWLVLVRAAAVVALALAFVLASRLGGRVAGVAAVVGMALAADVGRTTLLGSSEPILIALVLAAALWHDEGRRRAALAALGVAGLIRPEVWLLTVAYAVLVERAAPGRDRVAAALAVVAPIALWLGLDWLGSGSALHGGETAQTITDGSAANASVPALEVLLRAGEAVIVPVLVGVAVAAALAWRRHDRRTLTLVVVTLGWVAVVAILAQVGFTGARRYLAAPAALACVLAGVGLAWSLAGIARPDLRRWATMVVAAIAVAIAIAPVRTDARLLSVAGAQADQLDELHDAVAEVGGARAVLAQGRPVVNPWLQTALAWELDAPIDDVQATWSSSRRSPRWSAPAFVFRAPARLAGPRPVVPADRGTERVARVGRWTVFRAPAPGR